MVRQSPLHWAPAGIAIVAAGALAACSLLLPAITETIAPDGDADGDLDGDDGSDADGEIDGGDDADVDAETALDGEADRDEPVEADVHHDADADVPTSGPIVHHDFSAFAADDIVEDVSGRSPTVDLVAEWRDPLGVTLDGGVAEVDGGFLLADLAESQALSVVLVRAGSFTLAAWIATDNGSQRGPARIVTLSSSAYSRAFTFGQRDDALIVRLRCTATTENGQLEDDSGAHPVHFVAPVFPTTGLVHVVLVWDGVSGESRIYLDGEDRGATLLHDELGRPATLSWDTGSDRLGVGDEVGSERRPWQGSIADLTIYDRALTETEVAELFGRGP